MKPSAGTVTTPPITAPRPSVAPSRNRPAREALDLLVLRHRSRAGRRPSPARHARPRLAARARATGVAVRRGRVAHPHEAEKTAIAAPTATIDQPTTRPTRTHTTADREADRPEARTRERCACLVPRSLGSTVNGAVNDVRCAERNSDAFARRVQRERARCRTPPSGGSTSPAPPALISISGGHSRVPSAGPLCVASMPSLPPQNCRVGAWSRWSSGPSRQQHVALRVDVGADAEEDLLVVVDVDPLVDDDHRLRQRQQAEPPDRVHHLLRVAGERLRIETMQQLWNAPATGRS